LKLLPKPSSFCFFDSNHQSTIKNIMVSYYHTKIMFPSVTAILVILSATLTIVHGFPRALVVGPSKQKELSKTIASLPPRIVGFVPTSLPAYGKGAEIWPESQDDAIQLSDSFPYGQVPYAAVMAMEQSDLSSVHQCVEASVKQTNGNNVDGDDDDVVVVVVDNVGRTSSARNTKTKEEKKKKRRYLNRILRRAAAKEELVAEQQQERQLSWGFYSYKTPLLIAFSLIGRGWIRPMDIVVVACLSTYFIILNMTAQSVRDGTSVPILPATPPQGHIPTMLLHPLGRRMERSIWYNTWLKVGILLGWLGPLSILFVRSFVAINMGGVIRASGDYSRNTAGMAMGTIRVYARPLFLLCCQIVTEILFRRSLVRS
jgi:hypothetical protein